MLAHPISGIDGGLRDALEAAELPTEDLHEAGRRFFRFQREGRIVGYGGFETHGAYALLRSIVVLPDQQGKGIGRAIVAALHEQAVMAGCFEAFLLTTTAEGFFEHLGFHRIERDRAPAAILATKQAATICSTAALFTGPFADA